MKTPKDILAPIKTRGGFRQATEFAQKQHGERQNVSERLISIWAALADAYGSAFTSQFGDEPNGMWIGGLAEYSMDKIEAGITHLLKSGETYAPNLGAVIGAITLSSDWEQAASRLSVDEVMSRKRIDLGERPLMLETEEAAAMRKLGTPDTNPNYFSDLMAC